MNSPKVKTEESIQFLVASPVAVSGTEAARVHAGPLVAHDAYTRLLHRLEPDTATRWQEARGLVTLSSGVLVLDDTTRDKSYARHMGLVTRHWSGKHQAVVQGINLLTLLWSDGRALVPVDYRLYDKATDELSKNDHFQAFVAHGPAAGLRPALRLVRQLVRQSGQPQAGVRLRLALADPAQAQPTGQPRRAGPAPAPGLCPGPGRPARLAAGLRLRARFPVRGPRRRHGRGRLLGQ